MSQVSFGNSHEYRLPVVVAIDTVLLLVQAKIPPINRAAYAGALLAHTCIALCEYLKHLPSRQMARRTSTCSDLCQVTRKSIAYMHSHW